MNNLRFLSAKKNPLVEKSYIFSIKIVKTVQGLQTNQKEFILSKQLLRSGTAIGALIFEGQYAQSQADFINKLSISLKEANETKYWIVLLNESEYIDNSHFSILLPEIEEIIKMLTSSIKTTKQNLK
jgi:four helix bundle protein